MSRRIRPRVVNRPRCGVKRHRTAAARLGCRVEVVQSAWRSEIALATEALSWGVLARAYGAGVQLAWTLCRDHPEVCRAPVDPSRQRTPDEDELRGDAERSCPARRGRLGRHGRTL